eukprot:SAG22_NODE_4144_length_1368_cov_1.855004_2_plen_61_part_00
MPMCERCGLKPHLLAAAPTDGKVEAAPMVVKQEKCADERALWPRQAARSPLDYRDYKRLL